jgi:alkyldihydroxyacetonephosphate synthase
MTDATPRDPTIDLDGLRAIVGHRFVLTSRPDRLAYNNDCWPRGILLTRGHQLQAREPAAIVQPADVSELQALIRWANDTHTPIIPFGAGSGVCGGTLADASSVVIDLKRMRDMTIDAERGLLHAQAGLIGMNMEQELNRRGFTLGHYPSSLICSSVGGYLAARSSGQYSSYYGKIEDMVASVRVVTGTGDLLDTADPTHERDWTQLMVGAEGTLGVITDATLFIHPLPSQRLYRAFQFESVEDALESIRAIMQQGARPAVVRLYDALDTLIVKRPAQLRDKLAALQHSATQQDTSDTAAAPGMLSRVRGWMRQALSEAAASAANRDWIERIEGAAEQIGQRLMERVLGQPMWLDQVAHFLPQACMLIVGFEGTGSLIHAEAQFAFDQLGRRGLDLGVGPAEHWYENRFSVSYKQSAVYAAGAFVDTMEVSAPWSTLLDVYRAVREALSPHVLVLAHFSHVYPEGSSIYFTFTGFGATLDETLERYDLVWRLGLEAVAKAGGSVAHHHGVGLSKAPYMHYDHRGGHALFEQLKQRFDPRGVNNPGKVWPSAAPADEVSP